ncbi:cyclase family protein [Dickeya oryzae]|uniref:Cyclase family protein n=1 Tax=Dickeya oryzae TaxID=1240404 RepID=A0AB39IGA5_9GAMM|nr:cyclase family protein [Dickeya oryzae]MBP2859091.1 cyclase family protein [Dickeya oryzae]MCA6993035.1 cyclase family protein [Dickeya oryzae]
MKKIIDLSVTIENGVNADPPGLTPRITYSDHNVMAPVMAGFFPGVTPQDFPDAEGWAVEEVTLTTHAGTHMDAPWHYASTMNHGERAATIDEIPLDWCFRPGVKLDFRHFPDGYVVTADDVEQELGRIQHTLNPLDIVLVNTAAGMAYGKDHYINTGCGMGRETTLYLLERGVRVTGTDGWSWDVPFKFMSAQFAKDGDTQAIWQGHRVGRDIGYCHMEKLHNLESLPDSGFTVACFPVKIHAASAGWTRAVAIIEE